MGLNDLFKSAGDLFKSAKTRERERSAQIRRGIRRVERKLQDGRTVMRELEVGGDKAWREAGDAMKAGQKVKAQGHLNEYRNAQLLISKVTRRQFVVSNMVTQLRLAKDDGELVNLLGSLAESFGIDPGQHEMVLDVIGEKLGEQGEVDSIWESEYSRLMRGTEGATEEFVPSIDELARQLEDEVAEEVIHPEAATPHGEVDDRITEARSRVQDLLDEEENR